MAFEKCTITPMSTADPPKPIDGQAVVAHFNPQTLTLTYQAVSAPGSQGPGGNQSNLQQLVQQRTAFRASLGMSLIFDTTRSGEDVRNTTSRLSATMAAFSSESSPLVQVSWGTFLFYGEVVQLTETIDYFSDQGVPLRSSIQLSIAGVELSRAKASGAGAAVGAGFSAGFSAGASLSAGAGFSAGASLSAGVGFSAGASLSAGVAVGTTPLTLAASGESVQSLAAQAGLDWKAVAAANNIDNPRQLQAGTVLSLKGGVKT